ncbi:Nucleoside-diphosphate-sugar epimerase [Ruminococcaceae bacterium YRB3002]|nr:Nucleoside-diphosphate-sugar epimerase [Ruminococcaceae bacterium YRB3002]
MDLQILDRVINDNAIGWDSLRGSSILVTGGTGLVGSVIVRVLLRANEVLGLDTAVTIVTRDSSRAGEVFGALADQIRVITSDIKNIDKIKGDYDYIIHCAAVTDSKSMITKPVETIDLSYNGTLATLKLASQQHVKGMVYISSMEIYGVTDKSMNPISEKKLGYVDLTNVRSSYQESKRICELLCNSYAQEYGVPVMSARLAQTFGFGVRKTEGRIFAQFAKAAMEGSDIVLHTRGESVGNYVDTLDMAAAVLLLLTRGTPGQAYNVANESNSCMIREMAQLVADNIAGGKTGIVYDIPESNVHGYAPDTAMRLDASRLRELGWSPRFSLEDMYRNMMDYWKEV